MYNVSMGMMLLLTNLLFSANATEKIVVIDSILSKSQVLIVPGR